ncbi:MAG: hypothetical protein LBM76_03110 [Mycoplasmataceae bacterium]|nr:hypothetical protein [Mycoplasmataceae bacterium]
MNKAKGIGFSIIILSIFLTLISYIALLSCHNDLSKVDDAFIYLREISSLVMIIGFIFWYVGLRISDELKLSVVLGVIVGLVLVFAGIVYSFSTVMRLNLNEDTIITKDDMIPYIALTALVLLTQIILCAEQYSQRHLSGFIFNLVCLGLSAYVLGVSVIAYVTGTTGNTDFDADFFIKDFGSTGVLVPLLIGLVLTCTNRNTALSFFFPSLTLLAFLALIIFLNLGSSVEAINKYETLTVLGLGISIHITVIPNLIYGLIYEDR